MPRHWLLAAIILSFSSCLMTSETHSQFALIPSYNSLTNEPQEGTNRSTVTLFRRRRYVRFPSGSTAHIIDSGPPIGRNLGPSHPNVRFGPNGPFTSWRQHRSVWRGPVGDYNRPIMAHRSPRLIFRDNDFLPPIGTGSFFQQSNQLPDFEDEIRGETFFLRL